MAIVSSAGLPNACHASQRSRKNISLSLLREPRGRPLGLPDWPGFQGINPRCLCSRTVESLFAASAFDMGLIKPTSWLVLRWQNRATIWHAIARIVEHLSLAPQ